MKSFPVLLIVALPVLFVLFIVHAVFSLIGEKIRQWMHPDAAAPCFFQLTSWDADHYFFPGA